MTHSLLADTVAKAFSSVENTSFDSPSTCVLILPILTSSSGSDLRMSTKVFMGFERDAVRRGYMLTSAIMFKTSQDSICFN